MYSRPATAFLTLHELTAVLNAEQRSYEPNRRDFKISRVIIRSAFLGRNQAIRGICVSHETTSRTYYVDTANLSPLTATKVQTLCRSRAAASRPRRDTGARVVGQPPARTESSSSCAPASHPRYTLVSDQSCRVPRTCLSSRVKGRLTSNVCQVEGIRLCALPSHRRDWAIRDRRSGLSDMLSGTRVSHPSHNSTSENLTESA